MLRYLKCAYLHSMHEVGASAESKYAAGSEMLRIALRSGRSQQHRLLHWALDVVLCGGHLYKITTGTEFQRRYWELGHRIASEILKHQEILNIDNVWFEPDFDAAVARLSHEATK